MRITIFIDRDLVLISLVVGFLVAGLVVAGLVVGLVVGLNESANEDKIKLIHQVFIIQIVSYFEGLEYIGVQNWRR